MKSTLNGEISIYRDFNSPEPFATMPLYKWLVNKGYKDEILEIRKCSNSETIRELKAQLPACTPSGIFKKKRSINTLVKHSGFICIDIDGKDNPSVDDWIAFKFQMAEVPNIAFAGLSASGKGVYTVIPIAYPEKHQQHFKAMELFFLTSYGIYIDKACKDVCRLRGISYDADPYVNHHAIPVTQCLQSPIKTSLHAHNRSVDRKASDRILAEILSLKTDITEVYSDWFGAGCAIANIYGEAGRAKYHDISSLSNKYNHDNCNRQYDACLKTKYHYSLGTLAYLLKKYSE